MCVVPLGLLRWGTTINLLPNLVYFFGKKRALFLYSSLAFCDEVQQLVRSPICWVSYLPKSPISVGFFSLVRWGTTLNLLPNLLGLSCDKVLF